MNGIMFRVTEFQKRCGRSKMEATPSIKQLQYEGALWQALTLIGTRAPHAYSEEGGHSCAKHWPAPQLAIYATLSFCVSGAYNRGCTVLLVSVGMGWYHRNPGNLPWSPRNRRSHERTGGGLVWLSFPAALVGYPSKHPALSAQWKLQVHTTITVCRIELTISVI